MCLSPRALIGGGTRSYSAADTALCQPVLSRVYLHCRGVRLFNHNCLPVHNNCFHPGGGFQRFRKLAFYAALVLLPFICLPPFLFLPLRFCFFARLHPSLPLLFHFVPSLSPHSSPLSNQLHLFHKQLVSLYALMNMIPQLNFLSQKQLEFY